MKTQTMALIAHDGKKAELLEFVNDNREFLQRFHLIGTGTTGRMLSAAGIEIEPYLSGPLGGDAQIAADVATGRCHAVIFFRDPLGKHPHDPDISMLMRICDVHDVPLATNAATARLLVRAESFGSRRRTEDAGS
jgi:methylglyoxal synthase